MARPQVADGGTASIIEGSCDYVEYAVAESRQGVVLQLGVWASCRQLLTVKTGFVTKHEDLPWTCIDTLVWTGLTWLRIGTGDGHL